MGTPPLERWRRTHATQGSLRKGREGGNPSPAWRAITTPEAVRRAGLAYQVMNPGPAHGGVLGDMVWSEVTRSARGLAMIANIRATYSNGVLTPLGAARPRRGQGGQLSIEAAPQLSAEERRRMTRLAAGRWKGTHDPEELLSNIYSDRLVRSRHRRIDESSPPRFTPCSDRCVSSGRDTRVRVTAQPGPPGPRIAVTPAGHNSIGCPPMDSMRHAVYPRLASIARQTEERVSVVQRLRLALNHLHHKSARAHSWTIVFRTSDTNRGTPGDPLHPRTSTLGTQWPSDGNRPCYPGQPLSPPFRGPSSRATSHSIQLFWVLQLSTIH